MAAVADTSQAIKDAYYAGDIAKSDAIRSIRAIICEFLEVPDGQTREWRAAKSWLLAYAYMELETDC